MFSIEGLTEKKNNLNKNKNKKIIRIKLKKIIHHKLGLNGEIKSQ